MYLNTMAKKAKKNGGDVIYITLRVFYIYEYFCLLNLTY